MTKTKNQCITGSGNIQVAGNYISNASIITDKIEIICNHDIPITNEQAKIIRGKISEIREKGYQFQIKDFYEKFNVTSYKHLSQHKFQDAVTWIENQKEQYIPELRCMKQ